MKKALIILMALTLAFTTAACGANKPSGDAAGTSSASSAADSSAASSSAASSSAASSSAASSSAASASAASADATTDAVISTGSVWNYTYAGNEHDYLKAITKTLCELDAENFELKDGMIPCFTILEIDNEDANDIKVWGLFDIYNYTLRDKVLVEESGGRFPGLFHLKENEDGSCVVTDSEFIPDEDAAAYEKLADGHEMALAGFQRQIVTEESRRYYLSEFVKAEGLDATSYQLSSGETLPLEYEPTASPEWVATLPEASETDALIVVDITVGSNAVLTMHEKGEDGSWTQTIDEAAYIGKNGPNKTQEGDLKTPIGTFGFNAALGINDDPGCAIPYTKVDDTYYWVGDSESDMYNKLVTTNEYTDFDPEASELIVDYPNAYKYILNTTYNEDGTPMKGSAIFLHCYREQRTYTGGCISIPFEKMEYVMTHIKPDSKIIIRMMGE